MSDGKTLRWCGGNMWTRQAKERNKTAGRSVGVTTRRRRFWSCSMSTLERGGNSPYDWRTEYEQPQIFREVI